MKRLLAYPFLALAFAPSLHAQQDAAMTAKGTFDVTVTPVPADDSPGSPTIGRLSLDKQFHGDLEAGSKGVMLGAGAPNEGSAGYVAMELVSGTLNGRQGSFVLQHMGSMSDGEMELTVLVVPASGTDQLTGLAGDMTIIIEDGEHSYEFDYTLPEQGERPQD